jgi:hypothetical protein
MAANLLSCLVEASGEHSIFSGKQFGKGARGRLASLFSEPAGGGERVHFFDGDGDDSGKDKLFADIIRKAGPR